MKEKFNSPSLDYLKTFYVDQLRIAMQGLSDTATRSLKNIEEKGINGYYSGNSDVHRYAANAWRASWALCELRLLEDKLKGELQRSLEDTLESILKNIKQDNTPTEE
jgi:hypothetical protein